MADNMTPPIAIRCAMFGEPHPVDKDIEVITSWMQSSAEAKTGVKYKTFKAVQCISQAGVTKFLIKVHVGGDDYVHLTVLKSPLLEDKITVTFEDAKGGCKKDSFMS